MEFDWAATLEIPAPVCVSSSGAGGSAEPEQFPLGAPLPSALQNPGSLSQLCSEPEQAFPPASPRIPLKNRPSGGLALEEGALFRPFLGLLCLNKQLLGPKHRCSFGNEKSN